jgi:hypothetical protein
VGEAAPSCRGALQKGNNRSLGFCWRRTYPPVVPMSTFRIYLSAGNRLALIYCAQGSGVSRTPGCIGAKQLAQPSYAFTSPVYFSMRASLESDGI